MIWSLEEKENWSATSIEQSSHIIADFFQKHHKKVVIPILFASIMGKKCGPPLFQSAEILGKERTRARFLQAIEFLGGISNKKITNLKESWKKNNAS